MGHVSTDQHRVRSYELDSYGHANNAAYMQWLEHGRSKLLQDFGLSYNLIETRWGVRFVLVSSRIEFRRGLRLGDLVHLTTTVKRFGTTSVTFEQKVFLGGQGDARTLSAEAETAIVFTDPGMETSRPIPEEFRALYG